MTFPSIYTFDCWHKAVLRNHETDKRGIVVKNFAVKKNRSAEKNQNGQKKPRR
jgi:hypothetical protein